MGEYDGFDLDDDTIDEYLIDEVMLQKLRSDEKYREFFKNNLDVLLAYNEYVEPGIVVRIIKEIPELKKFILNNLQRILPKVIHRDELYKSLSKRELEKNASVLFVPSASTRRISFKAIIYILMKKKFSPDEIKEFIVKNIDYIISNSGYHLPDDMSLIAKLFSDDDVYSEKIQTIDQSLARNIDIILKEQYKNAGFNYDDFQKYNAFKQRARDIGKFKFLLQFPVSRNMTVESCKKMCEELYESFDGIDIASMKLAKGDETSAIVYGTIINELICASNENRKLEAKETGEEPEEVKVEDFCEIGHGSFSKVYKVGDFVFKVDTRNRTGIKRVNPNIKNHRRILQPLIRGNINPETESRYIEVQNLIDTSWYQGMTDDEIEEVLYKIYSELRDSGLVWNDIKEENVGRLLKPNKSNLTFIDIDGNRKEIRPREAATGLVGDIPEEDVLKPGELVISDTDFIFHESDIGKYRLSAITEEFEERYQREKAQREDRDDGDNEPNI